MCELKPLEKHGKASRRARRRSPQPPRLSAAHISESRCWGWALSGTERSHSWPNPCCTWSLWWGAPVSRAEQLLQSSIYSAGNQGLLIDTIKGVQAWDCLNLEPLNGRTLTKLLRSMKVYVIKHPFLNWLSICKSDQTNVSWPSMCCKLTVSCLFLSNKKKKPTASIPSFSYQMPDCQQVLSSDRVSAWTRDLSHGQRKAQEQKHTQTLYLQLTTKHKFLHFCLPTAYLRLCLLPPFGWRQSLEIAKTNSSVNTNPLQGKD